MGKYYSEELNPKSQFRSEYEQSLSKYVDEQLYERKKQRSLLITPKSYKEDQEFYRQEFVKMLGFPLNLEIKTPKLLLKTKVTTDKNVNIYRMQFEVLDGVKFYGMYFEQDENPNLAPFVIGQHGKEGTPELCSSIYMDSSNYNHMIRRVTDLGANVFVPQTLLWSEKFYEEPYDRGELDAKLRQIGGCITALEVYIQSSLITYFIEKEGVNASKIGALGLSYGGMYTIHLAAFDKRIKSAYACSWFNCTEILSRMTDWCYKDAANSFGVAETAALICPRALAVSMGDKDQIFDAKNTLIESERLSEFYKEFNAEDKFLSYIFNGYHEFDLGDEGLKFFFNNL